MRIHRGALSLLALFAIGCSNMEQPSAPNKLSATGSSPLMAKSLSDPSPSGERINGQTALIPIYDLASGGIIYGSTPKFVALWPAHANPAAQGTFYLVVYPISAGGTAAPQCYDVPNETCPDHGPVIAGFAMQLNPAVYGNGVLGHDHLSPPHGDGFHVTEFPVLVLFTSQAAAAQHFTTKAEVDAAAQRGDVFMVPGEAFSFLNAIVDGHVYDHGTPWVCPAYTRCERPGDPPGQSK